MTARSSALLRWTEEAEAAQMCATAMFEREPHNVAACPLAVGQHRFPTRQGRALVPWLLSWLPVERLQIARDDRR